MFDEHPSVEVCHDGKQRGNPSYFPMIVDMRLKANILWTCLARRPLLLA